MQAGASSTCRGGGDGAGQSQKFRGWRSPRESAPGIRGCAMHIREDGSQGGAVASKGSNGSEMGASPTM